MQQTVTKKFFLIVKIYHSTQISLRPHTKGYLGHAHVRCCDSCNDNSLSQQGGGAGNGRAMPGLSCLVHQNAAPQGGDITN